MSGAMQEALLERDKRYEIEAKYQEIDIELSNQTIQSDIEIQNLTTKVKLVSKKFVYLSLYNI